MRPGGVRGEGRGAGRSDGRGGVRHAAGGAADGIDLTWRQAELTPNWDVEVQLSYLRDRGETDFRANPPGAFTGVSFLPDGNHLFIAQTERHWRLGATATHTGGERHRVRPTRASRSTSSPTSSTT